MKRIVHKQAVVVGIVDDVGIVRKSHHPNEVEINTGEYLDDTVLVSRLRPEACQTKERVPQPKIKDIQVLHQFLVLFDTKAIVIAERRPNQ